MPCLNSSQGAAEQEEYGESDMPGEQMTPLCPTGVRLIMTRHRSGPILAARSPKGCHGVHAIGSPLPSQLPCHWHPTKTG